MSQGYISKFRVERELIKYLSGLYTEVDLYSIVPGEYNDGCSDPVKFKNGKEYMTSAAKLKRKFLSDHSDIDSIVFQGKYIRHADEEDNIHLNILTQYDIEVKIKERSIDTLIEQVNKIWKVISTVYQEYRGYPAPSLKLISSSDLYEKYPDLDPEDRVSRYMENNTIGALFIVGIGGILKDGKPHDERCRDYDDFSMNGDLYVYHKDSPLELMSCGIRVNSESLINQCPELTSQEELSEYHRSILFNKYPDTFGGGLGKERTLMYILDIQDIRDLFYRT